MQKLLKHTDVVDLTSLYTNLTEYRKNQLVQEAENHTGIPPWIY